MSSENSETRTRILDATWRLLEAGRGQGVRMGDIAKSAGISRQAVYLHFPSRGELLVATTRHLDTVKDVDARLVASRTATNGPARLAAFIEAWGNYIPEVYGIAKALLAMKDTDAAANLAWTDRMAAVRDGCRAAVEALERDGLLAPDFTVARAIDLLWTLLSVANWEQLTLECGWPQRRYVETTQAVAAKILVAGPSRP